MKRFARLSMPILLIVGIFCIFTSTASAKVDHHSGGLEAKDAEGKSLGNCPLKHTDVQVEISGFVARVTVTQKFHNPFEDKIEAVYTFPLSQDSAVDDMTMTVGDRVIKGEIKERGEARRIYDAARAQGHVASLLDQERPNIFTQSVANIEPGKNIDIKISYTETLDWDSGEYHFDFPMVVGPRYMPGNPTGAPTTGWAPPTDQVPDANRISPPVAEEGKRAGHDISITVNLNAGLSLRQIDSKQHEIVVSYPDESDKSKAVVALKALTTIPNKDFVLVYETSSDEIEDTILTHTDKRGKFFTLVLQPPKRVRPEAIVARELMFVIDSSGSMSGFPIETAKEAMRLCINGLREDDTFNLITFAGGTKLCFDGPVDNTDENREKALNFLGNLRGSGGTEMMKAIRACLADQHDPKRVRIVCFMTDGYVGNDMAIVDAIKQNAGTARVFSFGIGRSVNRYLLDKMAVAGRGAAQYILSDKEASGAGEKFYERVRTPVLSDIDIDFGDLEVTEVIPAGYPDLFDRAPLVIKGQYKNGGSGTITLRGKTGEGKFVRKIDVTLPETNEANEVLAPLWARAKVDALMSGDLSGIQRGTPNPAIKEEILGLGLRYRLMTQFTSFVAVEHKRVTEGGVAKLVPVEVEMPEGVSHEGVFGRDEERVRYAGSVLRKSKGRAMYSYGSAGAAAPMSLSAPVRRSVAPAMPGPTNRPASTLVPKPVTAPAEPTIETADEPAAVPVLTPIVPGEKPNLAKSKLCATLQSLVTNPVALSPAGPKVTVGGVAIVDGKVRVVIELSGMDTETAAAIRKLVGVSNLVPGSKGVIGMVKVGDLMTLAKLGTVKRISLASPPTP